MTDAEEIASGTCGSCGKDKPAGQPLCSQCFFTLPRCNRKFLFHPKGAVLVAAYVAAKEWLAENRYWKGQRHVC